MTSKRRKTSHESRRHSETSITHAREMGVATPATTPTAEPHTPIPPHELTNAERHALKEKLNSVEKFFKINMTPAGQGKKRKRAPPKMMLQSDMFDSRLDTYYEVLPSLEWDQLKKYKRFTVGSESICLGECIFIKCDDNEDARLEVTDQWKAKVHEVRALDSEHVYLRVSWLNRPEDLPNGRQPHHGKYELIPSNEMDIIDAMAVNGRLDVVYLDELGDDGPVPAADQFFWRQTLDYMTQKFSDLPRICRDKRPQNPDELVLQCSNPKCGRWMHIKCLAEDAVEHAGERMSLAEDKEPAVAVDIGHQTAAQARAQKGTVTADVYIKGLPAVSTEGIEPAARSEVIYQSEDSKQVISESLQCMFCKGVID